MLSGSELPGILGARAEVEERRIRSPVGVVLLWHLLWLTELAPSGDALALYLSDLSFRFANDFVINNLHCTDNRLCQSNSPQGRVPLPRVQSYARRRTNPVKLLVKHREILQQCFALHQQMLQCRFGHRLHRFGFRRAHDSHPLHGLQGVMTPFHLHFSCVARQSGGAKHKAFGSQATRLLEIELVLQADKLAMRSLLTEHSHLHLNLADVVGFGSRLYDQADLTVPLLGAYLLR